MGLPIGDATVWKSATSINGDDDSTELAGLNSDDPEDSVIAAGTTAVAEVWRLATARDVKWTLELQRGSASVWSSEVNGQEILKSEGEIAISPLVLHQLLHKNIEKHPEWNPLTDVYEVVKTVDRFTDITYTVAPAMGGGMISPRDYVSIRKWLIKDGNVVIAEVGCEHPDRQVSLACARTLFLSSTPVSSCFSASWTALPWSNKRIAANFHQVSDGLLVLDQSVCHGLVCDKARQPPPQICIEQPDKPCDVWPSFYCHQYIASRTIRSTDVGLDWWPGGSGGAPTARTRSLWVVVSASKPAKEKQ